MTALIQNQPLKIEEELLLPLFDGKPVILKVDDPRLFKKSRAKSVFLFLAPLSVFGVDGQYVLASMPAYGCEIIDLHRLQTISFIRMGVSPSLSKALVGAFQKAKGRHNDSKSP